jgi:hypothetical protein
VTLSTSVDTTYADSGTDASVKQHQQDHDTIHAAVNAAAGGTTGQVWAKTSSADYAAAWQTPGFGGGDYFQSGQYSAGVFATNTSQVLTVFTDAVYYRPFIVPVRRAFDRIGVDVQTAASAGGGAELGIYSGAGRPQTIVQSAVTVTTTSTGSKEAVISQTLDPGVYWLALHATTAQFVTRAFPIGTVTPWASSGTAAQLPIINTGSGFYSIDTSFVANPTVTGLFEKIAAVFLRAA